MRGTNSGSDISILEARVVFPPELVRVLHQAIVGPIEI